MSILLCVPTDQDLDSRTAEAAFAICASHPGGACFRTVRAHPIDRCRNLCAEGFLSTPHTHLLFLDSDVVPPVDALQRMLAIDHPLVCGIYPLQLHGEVCTSIARKLAPDTYGFLHDFPDEPFEADAAGLGCCLIARELLEAIDAPWFRFVPRPDGHQTGEDIYFFERCAEIGVRPVVDPAVLCTHHKTVDLLAVFEQLRHTRRALAAVGVTGAAAA